jgi:ribulose-phosphate 3-epimerase
MAEIIPAIIAKTFSELEEKIKLVEPYVNWVQLDVMDGKFAPQKIGYQPEDLKKLDTVLNLEAHLMISEPEKAIDGWLNSGVKRILVHWEALANEKLKTKSEKPQLKISGEAGDFFAKGEQIKNFFDKCNKKGVGFGIVLNLETPIEVLDLLRVSSYMLHVVQLMSIGKIGSHGQPFDEKVIHKIGILKQKWPDVKISVDGGLNNQNILAAAEVGADNLVVGSAIFQSQDIGKTIQELENKFKIN